jgi:outer membrane lipoprotein-sorting protein
MRRLAILWLIGFVTAGQTQFSERDARAIVEKAIKAQGGEKALARTIQSKRKENGKQVLLNKEVPFLSEVSRSLPDRVRLEIELDRRIRTTTVLDGKRAWVAEGKSPAIELPSDRVREVREEAFVWYLTTLVPLLQSNFKLTTVDETVIEGEQAVGVRVTAKGYADSVMYFRKRSGLLARIDRKVSEGGVTISKQYVYGDYKEFDGVTIATRETVLVNGKRFTETVTTECSFPTRFEVGTFSRP